MKSTPSKLDEQRLGVAPVVARVTRRRLNYITELCVETGLPADQARRRILLLYSSYLGLFDYLRVRLGEDLNDSELRAYTHEMLDALVLVRGSPLTTSPGADATS